MGQILKETKVMYTDTNQTYIKRRRTLHLKIINTIVSKAGSPGKGEKPVAILMGGGTASGKTTLRETILKQELTYRGIKAGTVDADEIMEYLPEYHLLKKTDPNKAAYLVHKESCDIGSHILEELIQKRKHFIFEGTMTKTDRYLKLVHRLKKAGYEIYAYVVDVPLKIAKQRSDERMKLTGRKVPHQVIENTHRAVPKTVEAIKDHLDHYWIYDNQNGLKLIASKQYLDQGMYAKFLQKGGINKRKMEIPSMIQSHLRSSLSFLQKLFSCIVKDSKVGRHSNDYHQICNHDDLLRDLQ